MYESRIRIVTRAIFLLILGGTCAFGAGFRVEGSKIIAPNGTQFVAKSVNINGYQTNWKDEGRTIGDLNLVKNIWKFNHLRLYCRINPWNTGNRQQLHDIIKTYIEADMVVMLTFHDHTGGLFTGTDLTNLKSFNVEIVNKFKTHPKFTYLWFETMNEPGNKPLDDIDAMNRDFLTAIRNAGARDNIFVPPGNNWSQEGTQFTSANVAASQSYILTKGKAFVDWNEQQWGNRNIVFSPHFYRIWIHGDTKMATFIDDCYAKGLALVVGEYGVETPGGSTVEATKSLVRVGYPRKIGRSVWHWTGGDANDLTTSNTGRSINKTDGTKPTNLTWLGGVVWDDNHSNDGGVVAIEWDRHAQTAPNFSIVRVDHAFDLRGARLSMQSKGARMVILAPSNGEATRTTHFEGYSTADPW